MGMIEEGLAKREKHLAKASLEFSAAIDKYLDELEWAKKKGDRSINRLTAEAYWKSQSMKECNIGTIEGITKLREYIAQWESICKYLKENLYKNGEQ